jgi:predicted DNA-binding WGR domain protein
MRRFENTEDGNAKFWSPRVEDNVFIVVFGKIGTDGQRRDKSYDSAAEAQEAMAAKIKEKQREGYADVGAVSAPDVAAPAAKTVKKVAEPVVAKTVSAPLARAAVVAIDALVAETQKGSRGWRLHRCAREASRAVARLDGAPDASLTTAIAVLSKDVVLHRALHVMQAANDDVVAAFVTALQKQAHKRVAVVASCVAHGGGKKGIAAARSLFAPSLTKASRASLFGNTPASIQAEG